MSFFSFFRVNNTYLDSATTLFFTTSAAVIQQNNNDTKCLCVAVVCEGSCEPGGAAGGFLPEAPSLRLLWSQGAVHGLPDKKHLGAYSGECCIVGLLFLHVYMKRRSNRKDIKSRKS